MSEFLAVFFSFNRRRLVVCSLQFCRFAQRFSRSVSAVRNTARPPNLTRARASSRLAALVIVLYRTQGSRSGGRMSQLCEGCVSLFFSFFFPTIYVVLVLATWLSSWNAFTTGPIKRLPKSIVILARAFEQ